MNAARLAVVVALTAAACGGSSPITPTPTPPPPPTASAIVVTLASGDWLSLGATTQATATTTPPGLIGTWASSNPVILTADPTGNVRGLSSGPADVTYTIGTTIGRAPVRVVPDYAGVWSGEYSITGCTDTGVFTSLDFCKHVFIGQNGSMRATWTQTGADVIGTIGIATDWPDSERNTGRIEPTGRMIFAATITIGDYRVRASWDVNSLEPGIIVPASSLSEVWTVVGFTGEGRATGSVRYLRRR